MEYRPEVDGLRALAILPVVLFHAGFEPFSGGFVGVDIFFVISGYLITSIIIRDLKDNKFSFSNFYERRARRLLPALFAVMAVCSFAAIVSMPPVPLSDFGRDLAAVGFFASNIVFWRTSNYFSRPAEENPLMHMWSLAVEEQFYIFFPLLMVVLWQARSVRLVITVIASLFFLSLFISEWGWRNSPIANFFLLPPRAFELLAGSACALLLEKRAVRGSNILSLVGLTLIAISVISFDSSTPFPSLWTLIPVIGSFLVIAFSCPGTVAASILSFRPIVFIGLISYSTYLWHQPLFAFARLWSINEPSFMTMLILSVGAFCLGCLTWKFVENPFRNSRKIGNGAVSINSAAFLRRKQVFLGSELGLVSFVLLGGVLFLSNGLLQLYDPDDQYLLSIDYRQQGAYVERNFNDLRLVPFPENGRANVLVIGDSYAQDFVNVIIEAGLESYANISTYHINPQCSNLYVDGDLSGFINPEYRQTCSRQVGYNSPDLHVRMSEADTIIIVASWREWNVQFIIESFSNISRHTTAQLVLVGPKNFGPVSVEQILLLSPEERAELRLNVPWSHISTNSQMRELGLLFIDLHDIICGDLGTCPTFTENLRLISYDGGHLTREGAMYIGDILLGRSSIFREIFGL